MTKKRLICLLLLVLLTAGGGVLALRFPRPPRLPEGVESAVFVQIRQFPAQYPDHFAQREAYPMVAVLDSATEQEAFLAGLHPDDIDSVAAALCFDEEAYRTHTVLAAMFWDGCHTNPDWYYIRRFYWNEQHGEHRLLITYVDPPHASYDQAIQEYCAIVVLPKTDFAGQPVRAYVRWETPSPLTEWLYYRRK